MRPFTSLPFWRDMVELGEGKLLSYLAVLLY